MIVQSVFVLIVASGGNGGIATAEFMGKPACEAALAAFAKIHYAPVRGVFVPKMVVPSDAK